MKITDFKKNDTIIITDSPSYWSSTLSGRYPLGGVIFPYKCKIVNVGVGINEHYAFIDDNGYGWSLSCLIDEEKITSLNVLRRNKISRLNNF